MEDEHIKEASRVVQVGVGYSSYFAAVQYDLETFKTELASVVEYLKKGS